MRNLLRVAGTVSTAAAIACTTAAGAGAAAVSPAGLDPDLPVVTAGPGGAAFRTEPTTDSPVAFVLAGGRSANVACWILGDTVDGPFGSSARWFASPDGDSLVPAARVRLTGDVDPGSCEVGGWYGDDGYGDGHWHHRHVWHYGGTRHDFGHPGPVTGPPHTHPIPRPHTDPVPRPHTDPMPRPHTDPLPHSHTDPAPHTDPMPRPHTDPLPRSHTDPAPHPNPAPVPHPNPAPVPHPMPPHHGG